MRVRDRENESELASALRRALIQFCCYLFSVLINPCLAGIYRPSSTSVIPNREEEKQGKEEEEEEEEEEEKEEEVVYLHNDFCLMHRLPG